MRWQVSIVGESTAFELLSNIRLVYVTSGGKRLLGL